MSPTSSTPGRGSGSGTSLARSTLTVIALVFASVAALWLVSKLTRILSWLVVATFFAVVLHPALTFFERRLHFRRTLAAFVVFVIGMAAMGGGIYAFVGPPVGPGNQFVDAFPGYVGP